MLLLFGWTEGPYGERFEVILDEDRSWIWRFLPVLVAAGFIRLGCIAAADSREVLLAFSATGRIFSLVLLSIVCKIASLNIL